MTGREPFEEVVLGMIRDASSVVELEVLGTLLLRVKIPKNHDEIIQAWKDRCVKLSSWTPINFQTVVDNVLLHKAQVEAAERESENLFDRFVTEGEKHA